MFDDLPEGAIVNETPQLPPTFRLPKARRNYFGAVGLQVMCGRFKFPSILACPLTRDLVHEFTE